MTMPSPASKVLQMNELAGRYVRAVRQLHGLTLDELAQILDISRVKLARIETGSSALESDVWTRFCAELKVKPDALARRADAS